MVIIFDNSQVYPKYIVYYKWAWNYNEQVGMYEKRRVWAGIILKVYLMIKDGEKPML